MEIDGTSLRITIDGVESGPSWLSETPNKPEEDQWFCEMDWVTVCYEPSDNWLVIRADGNTTGKKRSALITAKLNNLEKNIKIDQAR